MDAKPYYDDGQCVIYHGDCRDFPLASWGAALLLTDPPYGMDYNPDRTSPNSTGSKRWLVNPIAGDKDHFDPSHLLGHTPLVLFGANWYADRLPASGGWLVWDKTPRGRKNGFVASDAELAWTDCGLAHVRKFALQWGGEARNGEGFFHPTQKPVALMRWILEQFTEVDALVLDPYMGGGSVGVASKELGRRYIGIEIEERYCEVAAKRLRQEVLPLEVTI